MEWLLRLELKDGQELGRQREEEEFCRETVTCRQRVRGKAVPGGLDTYIGRRPDKRRGWGVCGVQFIKGPAFHVQETLAWAIPFRLGGVRGWPRSDIYRLSLYKADQSSRLTSAWGQSSG